MNTPMGLEWFILGDASKAGDWKENKIKLKMSVPLKPLGKFYLYIGITSCDYKITHPKGKYKRQNYTK